MKKTLTLLLFALMAAGSLPARGVQSSSDDDAVVMQSPKSPAAAYRVGDYYEKGDKRGVVLSVDASGRHGRILALKDAPQKMIWDDARQWCEESGWELPTRQDLYAIYKERATFNKILAEHGGAAVTDDKYWSCEESYTINGHACAWYVRMRNGNMGNYHKMLSYCTRAVASF